MSHSPANLALDEFLQYLRQRGRDRQTIANYRHYLKRFFEAGGLTSTAQVDATAVARFQAWLTQRRLQPTTANYHRSALRMFLRYGQNHGWCTMEPTTVTMQPVALRRPATLQEFGINRLLHFPLKLEGLAVLQHRDRAILELISSSGLRVSEIATLRREQFLPNRHELAVHGRQGKLRLVPITQQAR